jgi:hypothetical protein
MSHFPDLTPHTYANMNLDALNVGYLSADQPYTKGEVEEEFLLRLSAICLKPLEVKFHGAHSCELCPRTDQNKSALIQENTIHLKLLDALRQAVADGMAGALDAFLMVNDRYRIILGQISTLRMASCGSEFRFEANGRAYAGPTMILHYIVAHEYQPPQEFIQAVMSSPGGYRNG